MPGASCKAALFLKSFVDDIEPGTGNEEAPLRWAHIDIAGTMEVNESCLMEFDTFLICSAPDDKLHTLLGKRHDWAASPVSNILRGSPDHVFMTVTITFNSALVEWAKRQGE